MWKNIPHEDILVKFLLHLAHTSEENGLVFRRQALLNVNLEPSEHKGSQNLVQLRDEFVLLVGIVNVEIEPVVELLGARKYVGKF